LSEAAHFSTGEVSHPLLSAKHIDLFSWQLLAVIQKGYTLFSRNCQKELVQVAAGFVSKLLFLKV
jgi:hypothetical protein